jgi:hypothetical protein
MGRSSLEEPKDVALLVPGHFVPISRIWGPAIFWGTFIIAGSPAFGDQQAARCPLCPRWEADDEVTGRLRSRLRPRHLKLDRRKRRRQDGIDLLLTGSGVDLQKGSIYVWSWALWDDEAVGLETTFWLGWLHWAQIAISALLLLECRMREGARASTIPG